FDSGTALTVEPVGRVFGNAFEPQPEADQGLTDRRQASRRLLRQLDEVAIELGGLGLDAVAHILPAALVACIGRRTYGGEQRLDRSERVTFCDSLEPAVAGQCFGGLASLGDRLGAGFVVTRDVGKPCGETPPTSARAFFRPQNPAFQLDRLLAGQRGRERT